MPRICFVSDLHMFANRSRADGYLEALTTVAADRDACILGGDIFDFKWSTLPSTTETINAAVNWLEEFSASLPHCQVHMLLGNHDDHPALTERLPELASSLDNFEWERFHLCWGDTVFLHGDVADRQMTAACLKRRREQFRHGRKSPLQHRLYDAVVQARLHQIAPTAIYPTRRVARRILAYLRSSGVDVGSQIKHVYFGHTHRPVNGYTCDGVQFHNCGAPIGAGRFRILTHEIEDDQSAERGWRREPDRVVEFPNPPE